MGKPKIKILQELVDGHTSELAETTIELAEKLMGEAGKPSKLVLGVIRNTGSGWGPIDENHELMNVSSITQTADGIEVNYNFTSPIIGSFIAGPDEDMAKDGYMMGASVGFSKATIKLSKLNEGNSVSVYSDSSGNILHALGKNITSVTWDDVAKVLTVNHPTNNDYGINCVSKNPNLDIRPILNGAANTTTMKFSFFRKTKASGVIYWTSGTTFVADLKNNITSAVWDDVNKQLVITHPHMEGFIVNPISRRKYQVVAYQASDTTTTLRFFLNGAQVNIPDVDFNLFFNRISDDTIETVPIGNEISAFINRTGNIDKWIDPSTVISLTGNIWFIGVLQV